MEQYLKAFVPLVVGAIIAVVDKLVVGDDVPDAVWLTLFGVSPAVWAIPNKGH